jgi:hypothetical protein
LNIYLPEADDEPNNITLINQLVFKEYIMKRILSLALAASLVAFFTIIATDAAHAQSAKGQGKAATAASWGSFDDDGDGILNCNDPDYVKPLDGTGKKLGRAMGNQPRGGSSATSQTSASTLGTGTGVCDGTGPKGKGRGK